MGDPNRKALDPPRGPLTAIDDVLIGRALTASRNSARRRVIQPFHGSADDPLHRMLNAVQPDSYIPPHRHLDPPKAEAWVLLRGALVFFTFEDDGKIRDCLRLGRPGDPIGVDLHPGVYHAFVAIEPDTLIYEVKPGPWSATTDKSFAPWAPAEGDVRADAYRRSLLEEARHRGLLD